MKAYFILTLIILSALVVASFAQAQGSDTETKLATGITTRVSIAPNGGQGNRGSHNPSTSSNGRYLAFASEASNFVPGDTNGRKDIFVLNGNIRQIRRVSITSDGIQAGDYSELASISADGRYVAFISWAHDLVPDDDNGTADTFLHDTKTGKTHLISMASDGTSGDDWSGAPSLSADGRYVAFESDASNLVPADTNDDRDIFVHDTQTGKTTRVSVASDGTQVSGDSTWPSISADGRYVAFESSASNLVPADTNGGRDIFVHDTQTGKTTRVSVASNGTQGNNGSTSPCAISDDGRYVAFNSAASNLVPADTNNSKDIFVHDMHTSQTTRISVASDGSQGNDDSAQPSISANGRYVAFESDASNLVPADTNNSKDIFVHDMHTSQTRRVSVASDGIQGNHDSAWPSISNDGRCIAFESFADNLVPDDTNNDYDIFLHAQWSVCIPYPTYLPLVSRNMIWNMP